VFVKAIDSLLYLLTYLAYFGTVTMGVSYSVLKYIIPTFTLASYIIVTYLLLKKIRTSSNAFGIYLTQFPKNLFTVLIILAICIVPVTNKLSGAFAANQAKLDENSMDFIEFYGWLYSGIGISRWVVLIALAIIYFRQYNSSLIKD